MFTKTWPFSPHRLLPLMVLLAPACSNDRACPSCPGSGGVPIPNVAGVWSVGEQYVSGGIGIDKHLVVELSQSDSVLGGHIGGSISYLSDFGFYSTTYMYQGTVTGHVTRDSIVTLQWTEESTPVTLQGRIGPDGLSGDYWQARRESPVSVAQAESAPGDTVIVRGVVTVSIGGFFPGNVVYVQDGSGGIEVVGLGDLPVSLGDSVLIEGVSGIDVGGERAILPIYYSVSGVDPWPPEVARLGFGNVPAPQPLSVADLAAETMEGRLVTLDVVHLVSKPSSASGEYSLTFADNTGATFIVFVHATVASAVTLGSWVVGATYDLTGILGTFNSGTTRNLQLRGPDDRVRR